jgi:CubicO group peptidase (beta-lactamase class C family)
MFLRSAVSFVGSLIGMFCLEAEPVQVPSRPPRVAPREAGLDANRLNEIDSLVTSAIAENRLPGAVVCVLRHGKIGFLRAYGLRSRLPVETPMTPDTVFDLASLTKPITATAIMMLLEQGKLQLGDCVARQWPAFAQNGKEAITIEQLLLHTSGLIADNPISDYEDGRDKALEHICQLRPIAEPGSKFIYSDVNYIILGELIGRLSGEKLDVFCQKQIFDPLGMRETMFRPGKALAERAAPTDRRGDHWIVGEVHDPRAFLLGGVAGHAGVFSTAEDLAVFVQMILNEGEFGGRRILKPETVRLMTQPRPVGTDAAPRANLRALGWDVQTAYSANRGDGFPAGKSFGHTGFTGTSLWIDPTTQSGIIFLSNRLHPDGKGNVNRLRGQVASVVAASLEAGETKKPTGNPPVGW